MSLKAFHILFILCSIALCFFFAWWCQGMFAQGLGSIYRTTALGSLISGVGLVVYGITVVRKLKGVSLL